ncbi:dUTP diphosphatase [Lachnospiraceae bacterium OttesenSCG-928-E19]|nr:dUTP diphosphatase [Lachnospiraceae bacterium OttesenSCG-928-E19]
MKIKIKFASDEVRKIYQESLTRGIEWSYGDSGIDLRSIEDDFIIQPGETRIIQSGIAFEMTDCDNDCYEVQLRPRSSMSKRGILCHFGTIDFNYRGFMGINLSNISDQPFEIKKGDRINQMVIAPVLKPTIEFTDELSETERNAGGFGSTGRM